MITLFTTPRPFEGKFNIIQRNAIKSWLKVFPDAQILLFEDEKNTGLKVAGDFGLEYIGNVKKDEFGTPIFSDVLEKAVAASKNNILAYINTDIILFDDLLHPLDLVNKTFPEFLMVGQRRDLDIEESIDFGDKNTIETLYSKTGKKELHHAAAIDYFFFSKSIYPKINFPPFIVGRPFWDGWFLWKAESLKIPVIDATLSVIAIHQNHGRQYGFGALKFHSPQKIKEFKINLGLAGIGNAITLKETTWLVSPEGVKRKKRNFIEYHARRYLVVLLSSYPFMNISQKIIFLPLWGLALFIKTLFNFYDHLIHHA